MEIPGNELRVAKKKKRQGKPILGYLASSKSVQSSWAGGRGDPPPEKGFQQDPPFLHLDLEKAPGQVELGEGWVERRGEKKQKGPLIHRLS